jgi:hypothetical protein
VRIGNGYAVGGDVVGAVGAVGAVGGGAVGGGAVVQWVQWVQARKLCGQAEPKKCEIVSCAWPPPSSPLASTLSAALPSSVQVLALALFT